MSSDWGGLDFFFLLDFKEKDCFLLEVFFELAVMFASLKLPSGCSYMLIISACFFLRVFLCVYAVYQDVCVVFSFPLFPLCSYRCFQVACHTFFSICLFFTFHSRFWGFLCLFSLSSTTKTELKTERSAPVRFSPLAVHIPPYFHSVAMFYIEVFLLNPVNLYEIWQIMSHDPI